MELVALGSAVEDVIAYVDALPPRDGKVRTREVRHEVGGNCLVACCAAQRVFGRNAFRAALLTVFGDDDRGARLVKTLEHQGVLVSGIVLASNVHTPWSFVAVDGGGTRTIFCTPPSRQYGEEEADAARIQQCIKAGVTKVLLTDGQQLLGSMQAVQIARHAGDVSVVLDAEEHSWCADRAGWEELFAVSDVVVSNVQFALKRTACLDIERALELMSQRKGMPRIVVATDGERGSHCRDTDGKVIYCPAYLPQGRPVFDSTGAGDVFIGALCAYAIEDGGFGRWNALRCLRAASFVAGTKITSSGLRMLPQRTDIDAYLASTA